jgi:hypothetical protein
MMLRAVSIDKWLGVALRGGAMRGEVLSAHREAAYLTAGGGRLIVLAREGPGNGPGYLLLEAVGSFSEGTAALFPGEPYETTGSSIRVAGGRIEIETRGAPAWDASFAPGKASRSRPPLAASALLPRGSRLRFPAGRSVGAAVVRERIAALSRALWEDDTAAVGETAASLIGLGDGLTPSCDDLLVGLAAVLVWLSADPRRGAPARRAFKALGAAIARRGERTTAVSRHFLAAASEGRFTERVKGLVRAIFDENEKRVAAAAKRVLECGATSGADLIEGVRLGCVSMGLGRGVRRR